MDQARRIPPGILCRRVCALSEAFGGEPHAIPPLRRKAVAHASAAPELDLWHFQTPTDFCIFQVAGVVPVEGGSVPRQESSWADRRQFL